MGGSREERSMTPQEAELGLVLIGFLLVLIYLEYRT